MMSQHGRFRLNIWLEVEYLTAIHQFYDSASTRLRLQSFGIRLDDEPRVGTLLRRNLMLKAKHERTQKIVLDPTKTEQLLLCLQYDESCTCRHLISRNVFLFLDNQIRDKKSGQWM